MGASTSKVTRRYSPKPKLDTLYKPITDPGEYTLPASVLRDQQRRQAQQAQEAVLGHKTRDAAGAEEQLGGPSQVRQQVQATRQQATRQVGAQKPDESNYTNGKDMHFLEMLKQAGYGEPLNKASATAASETASSASSTVTTTKTAEVARRPHADPSGNLFTARKHLAEQVKAHTEQLEASLGAMPRQWLEMSEIVRLLEQRKQGASEQALEKEFGLDASVLARLGKSINTPTVTAATDEHGNAKGVWQDRV